MVDLKTVSSGFGFGDCANAKDAFNNFAKQLSKILKVGEIESLPERFGNRAEELSAERYTKCEWTERL